MFGRTRTPMKRTALLRRAPAASTTSKVPKEGACAWCDKPFLKLLPMQNVCGPVCAGRKAKADRLAKVKAERAKDREQREAAKTLPKLHAEARYWFNRWIRLRDADQPCISCGKPPPDGSVFQGGRDCGHFRSVGQAGHLRYTPDNAAAQCVHCNQYLAGNYTGFRKGQLVRIGLERVEALENDNRPDKWMRDVVRGIRDDFKARCKALEGKA
jgi:hypothetical protein